MRLFRHLERYKDIIISILSRNGNGRIGKDELLKIVNDRLTSHYKLQPKQLTHVIRNIKCIKHTNERTTYNIHEINLEDKKKDKYTIKTRSPVYCP